MKLSSEVQRIARTRQARVEVTAGPGSGKTTAIVARVARLISKGQAPDRILILSFSKAAVENIGKRLASVEGGSEVKVKTCHAFGRHIILRNLTLAGLTDEPEPLSDTKALRLVGRAVKAAVKVLAGKQVKTRRAERHAPKAGIAWLREQDCRSALSAITRMFIYAEASRTPIADLIAKPEFEDFAGHAEILLVVRRLYRAAKKTARHIDYGDFIRLATTVLKSGKRAKGLQFDHLLVDEYQDTSPAQGQLFRALAARIANVMVVGDPRQGIFAFAGSVYMPLASLVDGVQLMHLTVSHRLTQATADFASALFAADPVHGAMPPIIGRPGGVKPVLVMARSEDDQAREAAARIRDLLKDGVAPLDIAILSRITAHLTPVLRLLENAGIRCTVTGRPDDTKHVINTLQLVELVEAASEKNVDARSVAKAMSISADKVPLLALKTLRTACKSQMLEGRYRLCSMAYMQVLGGVRSDKDIRRCLNERTPQCRRFGSALPMRLAVEKLKAAPAVEASSIHHAKGKEWRHVFIIGVTDGVLPDYRSTSPGRLVDERKAMFVAATRASETLTLVHAPQVLQPRHSAPLNALRPSQFLHCPKVRARMTLGAATALPLGCMRTASPRLIHEMAAAAISESSDLPPP